MDGRRMTYQELVDTLRSQSDEYEWLNEAADMLEAQKLLSEQFDVIHVRQWAIEALLKYGHGHNHPKHLCDLAGKLADFALNGAAEVQVAAIDLDRLRKDHPEYFVCEQPAKPNFADPFPPFPEAEH